MPKKLREIKISKKEAKQMAKNFEKHLGKKEVKNAEKVRTIVFNSKFNIVEDGTIKMQRGKCPKCGHFETYAGYFDCERCGYSDGP